MSQELQQLQEENKQIKDLLVNEVSARQQMGGRLEQISKSAQTMQIQFASAMQEIRGLAHSGDTEAIIKKVNSLIGEEAETANEVAPT
ncbi:MAG: hypothetical protein ACRCVV_18395 [Shewanella sp.]